jgi:hypothetical protein
MKHFQPSEHLYFVVGCRHGGKYFLTKRTSSHGEQALHLGHFQPDARSAN